MSIDKNIDDTLNLLKDASKSVKDNAKSLSDTIADIEDSIERTTSQSYDSIKDSLHSLKSLVQKTEERSDTWKERKDKEKMDISIQFFSLLTLMKNEIMNFDINNIDNIFSAFDRYDNTKKELFEELGQVLNQSSLHTNETYEKVTDTIMESLEKEKALLSRYNLLLSSPFGEIVKKIKELSSLFISLYDEYQEKINQIVLSYEDKKNALLGAFPTYKELFTDEHYIRHNIDNALDSMMKSIEEEYKSKQDKNYESFQKEANALISHLEGLVSECLIGDSSLKDNREKVIKDLKNQLLKNEKDQKLISKLALATDEESFASCLTLIYKGMENDTYQKYLKAEKELENEYLNHMIKARNNYLLQTQIAKTDPNDALIENNLYIGTIVQTLDNDFLIGAHKRIDLTFDFLLKEWKIVSELQKLVYTYNFEKDLISCSLNRDLNLESIDLKRKIQLEAAENTHQNKQYKNFFTEAIKEDSKCLALLSYEIDVSRVHQNYVAMKGVLLISFELFKKSQELDLLKPRFELEQIIDTYDVNRSSIEAIYNSEIKMLDASKTREELSNITNYEYAIYLMKHRTIVAGEMIDLTKAEYELRVKVLEETRQTSNEYSNHLIDKMVYDYLDQIQQMNEIKEIELATLLQKIELFGSSSAKDKMLNTEQANEILTTYQTISDKLLNLIKKDPEILDRKDDIKAMNEMMVEGLDRAGLIRNASLVEAVKSMKSIENEFHMLMNDFDEYKTIDYPKAFEEYKLAYLEELERINKNLDEDSTPRIDELNRIALYYHQNTYKEQYEALQKAHQNQVDGLYRGLLDRYSQIEENAKNNPYFKEKIDKELVDKVEELKTNYDQEKAHILKDFEENKVLLQNCYNQEISLSNQNYLRKAEDTKNQMKLLKQSVNERVEAMIKLEDSSLSSFKKLALNNRYYYAFEYSALKDDLFQRLKACERELKDKYKNPSVYTLMGKENKR